MDANLSVPTETLREAQGNGSDDQLRVFEDFLNAMEDGVALFDDQARFVLCNDQYLELIFPPGHQRPEKGTPGAEIIRAYVKAGFVQVPKDIDLDAFVRDRMSWATQFGTPTKFTTVDGRTIQSSSKATPHGSFLITLRDVTNEESAFFVARDMLLDAFQALDEGMVLCDEKMQFVFANDAWLDMTYGKHPHLAPKPGDNVISKVSELVEEGFYKIPAGQSNADYVAWMMGEMAQHGKRVPVELSDGRHLLGSSYLTAYGGAMLVVRDVTEQRIAEEARLHAINEALDAVSHPLVLLDSQENYVLSNLGFQEWIAPTGLGLRQGDSGPVFFRRLIDVGFFSSPEWPDPEEFYAQGMALVRGDLREFILHSSGDRIFQVNTVPTALGGYLTSFREITEQQRVEEELAHQREIAHQSEKLSALGELLAGVAHELNNPLSVVFGYSQMLQGKLDDPVLSDRLDMICQSAERAGKIVKVFLAMARQRPSKMEACSINAIVQTALEVSGYSLHANGVQLDMDLRSDVPDVLGDFDQLAQVFSNLIVNAGQALQDRHEAGRVTIRSFVETNQQRCVVEIRDNGPGIPESIQSRIFEPFFTTKDVGDGSGVGLAFSHKIIESHGGELSVRSSPQSGTSFFVRLPIAGPDQRHASEIDCNAKPTQPISVLVVDDEPGVATLLRDMVSDMGHAVTMSTNPREALSLATQQHFDVVLCDFRMPGMNGEEFHGALQKIAPRLARRCGFVVGDALSQKVSDFLASSGRPFVEKPVNQSELASLVQTLSHAGSHDRDF